MKKIFFIVSMALITTPIFAQQGGFRGPSLTDVNQKAIETDVKVVITTVAQAKQMQDDAKVTLKGHIVQHLGKDKYQFKDATGQLVIEIDDDHWHGVTVEPNDLVIINGEIDKESNSIEIDVQSLYKVAKQ